MSSALLRALIWSSAYGARRLIRGRSKLRITANKYSCSMDAHVTTASSAHVTYLGQEAARELDNVLFDEYNFSIDQLMEVAGLCCAHAVGRAYPLQDKGEGGRVLVVCGPGNNGGDGLVAARHLLFLGYAPHIFYPKRTSKHIYEILVAQCEKLMIPFLGSLPTQTEIDANYDIILDAIFGFSFKGALRAPFDNVLSTLRSCRTPICSVDVPSGWDVEQGNVSDQGISPDTLVSLTCPKLCAQSFRGRKHYLGLRMIPKELSDRFKLVLPRYPGLDTIVELTLNNS